MHPIQYAIAGIHTGIGKTIASAVLCKAMHLNYWKPVQAGSLDDSDTMTVQLLVNDDSIGFFPERFRLKEAASPHAAARLENLSISLRDFTLPAASCLIETAGGIMSPINDKETNIDLLVHFNIPVILISMNYLGSINHTMLTVNVLKQRNIRLPGILFNGHENKESEDFILRNTGIPSLGRLEYAEQPDAAFIKKMADQISPSLKLLANVAVS